MESEQEKISKELPEIESEEIFQTPPSVTWMKQKYAKFQQLTSKNISDNLWIIALKWILKGIMVFILIIMSPFILFVILFSLMIAG